MEEGKPAQVSILPPASGGKSAISDRLVAPGIPAPIPLPHGPSHSPMAHPPQPVFILGGFLITAEAYVAMVETLARLTGQPVRLVEVGRLECLLTVFPFAWPLILDRVATAATELAQASPTGTITLIGQSSGGIM